jgi:hypothetical protein
MNDQTTGVGRPRMLRWLWWLAAALCLAAVGVDYYKSGTVSWWMVLAAVFTIVMGIGAGRRGAEGGGGHASAERPDRG